MGSSNICRRAHLLRGIVKENWARQELLLFSSALCVWPEHCLSSFMFCSVCGEHSSGGTLVLCSVWGTHHTGDDSRSTFVLCQQCSDSFLVCLLFVLVLLSSDISHQCPFSYTSRNSIITLFQNSTGQCPLGAQLQSNKAPLSEP